MRFSVCSLLLLIVVILSGVPRDVFAAPFCVQITGMTPQCMYVDPAECRQRAQQLNGLCIGNPDELKIIPGSARYCLVNAVRAAICIYPDMQSCNKVAAKEGEAVCVDSGPTQQQQDLFRTEPGRRY